MKRFASVFAAVALGIILLAPGTTLGDTIWTAPVLLNTNGTTDSRPDSFPQIIEDSGGTLHAVWKSAEDLGGTAGMDWDIFYATNSGGGWSAPALLNTNGTTDAGQDEQPQIIEDSGGTLHAVWYSSEDLGGTAGMDFDIFYAYNSGGGWSAPVLLNTNGTTDSGWDWLPQIIEDGSGTLHAVWESTENLGGTADIDTDIFCAINSGDGWSAPALLNTNGASETRPDSSPQIIEDSSGTLHAVWQSAVDLGGTAGTDWDIFYATDSGSGWSAPALLNTNGASETRPDSSPQIIEDGSGTLHAVWQSAVDLGGTAGTDWDIFYATDSGSGWSAPALLNTNGTIDSGWDSCPQIIEDSSGTLHVVWYSTEDLGGTAGTDRDIFCARNFGSGWSAPTLLNTNGDSDSGDDYIPQIIEDGSGTLHAVWWSDENLGGAAGTDDDIFYATLEMELTQISLAFPADRSIITSAPTFMWTANGGTDNRYILDTGIAGGKKSFKVDASGWTMPGPVWDNIPSGAAVFWRVRGADFDHTPPTFIISDEVWSFKKQYPPE